MGAAGGGRAAVSPDRVLRLVGSLAVRRHPRLPEREQREDC